MTSKTDYITHFLVWNKKYTADRKYLSLILLATKAIDKGMPVEQLQTLLGHSQINTTMEYAIVNQLNVKASHKKYIT